VGTGEGSTLPWEQRESETQVQEPQSPMDAHRAASGGPLDERPELLVGAAFAGGFLLAQLLRRLGSDD
jgi:hypothetical protein